MMIEAVMGGVYTALVLMTFQCMMDHLFRGRTAMPVAVVDSQPVRRELKTVPEGYVVIREMTYGERIMRGGMTGAMKILKGKSDYAGELSMETQKLTLWDFANLVVEHNLQDKDGRELNFKLEADVRKLASKVGEEIGTYIDEINNFEDIEEGN